MKKLSGLLGTLAISIVFSVAATCQPTLTTINDTIYNSVTGTLFSGTVTIQGPNITSPTNIPVLGINRTITISNGMLSVVLVPNDTGSPASTYLFKFSNGDQKTCTVPTSPTPITMAAANCVSGTQPVPPGIVAISQLASGGAVTGKALCFGGTLWAPGLCNGRVPVPLTSSSACITGQFSSDANFHYDCIATNTWARVALATW